MGSHPFLLKTLKASHYTWNEAACILSVPIFRRGPWVHKAPATLAPFLLLEHNEFILFFALVDLFA